jgi:hypothetical protein
LPRRDGSVVQFLRHGLGPATVQGVVGQRCLFAHGGDDRIDLRRFRIELARRGRVRIGIVSRAEGKEVEIVGHPRIGRLRLGVSPGDLRAVRLPEERRPIGGAARRPVEFPLGLDRPQQLPNGLHLEIPAFGDELRELDGIAWRSAGHERGTDLRLPALRHRPN